MSSFVRDVADCFKTKSANSADLACRYVGGLLSETRRKNMERMDERPGQASALWDDSYQATQQFISTSRWDEGMLFQRPGVHRGTHLPGTAQTHGAGHKNRGGGGSRRFEQPAAPDDDDLPPFRR